MRYWITKDNTIGIINITLSKFAKIEGDLRVEINDKIKSSWPDCETWPRKFTKRVDTSLEIISGEVDLIPKVNTSLQDQLQGFKVA